MRKPILSAPISRLAAALVAGTLASTALVPLAHAQKAKTEAKKDAAKKPDKKTRDAARKAYGAGEKAYGAAKYAEAYDHFKKAYGLIPSPHAQYWMAMCLDQEGKSAEAYAAFKTFFANPRAEKVGDEKMTSAKEAFNKLKSTPGEVNFKTTPAGASISVDGEAQMGETPMTVKIPPGDHKIAVSAAGYETQKMDITIAPGEKQEQAVTLEKAAPTPAPAPAPAAPAAAPPATPAEPPAPPAKKSMVPAYVTLGIAGAGLIVGGIFGAKALGDKSKFNDNPTNDNADTTERDALIADMAFGVAITLGVTGVVLLTSHGSGDAAKESGSIKKLPPKATLNVAPYMSPHGGGAAARLTF